MDTGKVLLGRLYEKSSAKGNRYFTGRLGAARVVMMLDARADNPDPVWELFVSDGDSGHQKPAEGREGNSAPGQRKPYQRAPAANGRAGRAVRDHQAPLDRDCRADEMDMPLPDDMR